MKRAEVFLLKGDSSGVAKQERPDAEHQFREYYESNYRSLHRYVARLSGQPEWADDVTQEVFVALWKEIEKGSILLNARAWLYRVAGNLVINRIKAQSRARSHEARVDETVKRWHAVPVDVERVIMCRQLVSQALKQLPEPMRQCLLLYHEGLTGREIAEVLGVKPSYVGTLVLRAHERFRHECEALGGSYDLLG